MGEARPLREKRQHGDFLFPVNIYETSLEKGVQVPLYYHWHPEVELFFITAGSLSFQVEGEQFQLEAGDVLLIRPNALHGSHDCLKECLRFRAAVFDYHFLAGIENDRIEQEYLRPLLLEEKSSFFLMSQKDGTEEKKAEMTALFSLLNRLFDVFQKKEKGYELLTRAWLLEAMYVLLRYGGEETGRVRSSEGRSRLIRDIVRFVEEHYTQKLRLGDLAAQLSMSEGYLCRFFRKNFHMTFVEYVQRFRLQKAARLLLETDDPVGKIALDVGFGSGNYFTTEFGKYYHTTPQKYRKGQNNEKMRQYQEGSRGEK